MNRLSFDLDSKYYTSFVISASFCSRKREILASAVNKCTADPVHAELSRGEQ